MRRIIKLVQINLIVKINMDESYSLYMFFTRLRESDSVFNDEG